MDKIALYRKYRPNNFDQIYGQKVVVKSLESAIKNQEISHSYIFAGNKGSGKTTLAKIFSKAVNCLNLQNSYNPCNECANCIAIDKANTTDFVELDAASNNGINEVRNIIESIKYLPAQLKYKIYIIDEAHMLTTNSWNALLKTIEEPPHYVIFIFATTEYFKIPSTIISRCQRYDFNKISIDNLKSLINDVAKKEKINITNQAIETIAHMSDGAARDALSILDQLVNYGNKQIDEDIISTLFSTLNMSSKIDLLNDLFANNESLLLKRIDDYYNSGINLEIIVNDLLDMLMDKIIYLRTNDESLLTTLNKAQINQLTLNDEKSLMIIIDYLMQCTKDIKQSINTKFSFEYSLVKIFKTLFSKKQFSQPLESSKSFAHKSIPSTISTPSNTTASLNQNETLEDNNEYTTTTIKQGLFSTKDVTNKYLNENNKKTSNVPQVEEHDEKVNQWKLLSENKLDTLNKQVNNNDISKSKPTEIKLAKKIDDIKQVINDYNEAYKNNFFSIACHQNKELTNEYNKILANLKDMVSIYQTPITLMLEANKFLLVSENGCVVIFDNKAQAMRFNKHANDEAIQKFLKDKFGSEKTILGIDKNQVLIYKEEFKKINKKDFQDVKIIKNKDITKTKLLEILNDEDTEE